MLRTLTLPLRPVRFRRTAVTEMRPAFEAEVRSRLDAQDARVDALFAMMAEACRAAGLPVPDAEATMPMLRVVGRSA